MPVQHQGHFYNTEMKVGIHIMCVLYCSCSSRIIATYCTVGRCMFNSALFGGTVCIGIHVCGIISIMPLTV